MTVAHVVLATTHAVAGQRENGTAADMYSGTLHMDRELNISPHYVLAGHSPGMSRNEGGAQGRDQVQMVRNLEHASSERRESFRQAMASPDDHRRRKTREAVVPQHVVSESLMSERLIFANHTLAPNQMQPLRDDETRGEHAGVTLGARTCTPRQLSAGSFIPSPPLASPQNRSILMGEAVASGKVVREQQQLVMMSPVVRQIVTHATHMHGPVYLS